MKGGNCQRYTYISGLKPEKNRRRLRKNRPALLLPYTNTNSPAAHPQLNFVAPYILEASDLEKVV
jgi:hypothetical protein